MVKLLKTLDENILKIGISFLTFFIALYPKLPSVHINHTWVYIRLEDFSIALIVGIWLIQFLRRKVKLPGIFAIPIISYWVFGFLSLVLSLIIIAPTLLNFFPTIAILSFVRRLEYMSLFFVAFSSIKSLKDVRDYFIILTLTVLTFTLYGLGQKYYLFFWSLFPSFFEKYQFCFPSFQTGNEEFAKGIPLCLPSNGRITSTFAGHYDLGAYLVFIIPIFIGIIFTIRKLIWKIVFSIITLLAIIVLLLTASRVSFLAYVLGGFSFLYLSNKKKLIVPFFILSAILLMVFSSGTARRFAQTFRLTNVVTNSQGQVVGEAESTLTDTLKTKLANDNRILSNIATQDLPAGSGFIGLPQTKNPEKTNVAVVKSALSNDEAKRLKLENGGVEIATVSGNFLVRQALVYDISFTTRFQAEWPNAIKAFLKDPLFGSGYATITLATDNDYLRFLGESGILGLLSFLTIFLLFIITIKRFVPDMESNYMKLVSLGFVSGIVSLLINALLIDVFEASKVAESLWIISGVVMAGVMLEKKKTINYGREIWNILNSNLAIIIYLVVILLAVFGKSLGNFLVADDFTWAKWAANSTISDLTKNFISAQGFFYRPLDKFITFFIYTVFALKPIGYHLYSLILHFITVIGVFGIGLKIFSKRINSIALSVIFLLLPTHAENVFWFSTISTTQSTLFIVYSILFYLFFRERKSWFFYVLSVASGLLALFSYEAAVILLPLIVLVDAYFGRLKLNIKSLLVYLPFLVITNFYLVIKTLSGAVGAGGDYSYSIPHLIPNFIGNFIGYIGLAVFGENFLPLYISTRSGLRNDSIVVIFVVAILTIILGFVIFYSRERIMKLYQEQKIRLFVFGIIFAFISLLPFLGLGNITGRYNYLSSIGFSICFVLIIDILSKFLSKYLKKTQSYKYIFMFILFLLSIYYVRQLNHSNYEWYTAGKVTNYSLGFLRVFHEDLAPHSNLYFVNTPIKFQDAWVFPTGLNDGIWFVYRDDTLNIKNVDTISNARMLKSNDPTGKSFIFYFDKNEKMKETK